MTEHGLSLTFVRGARRVTGSNFLIEAKENGRVTRVLVDCGLTQGERWCDQTNTIPFPYEAKSIDALIVTHAHADHIGLIPRLVKEGFSGPIYATAPTIALMPIMLADTAKLMASEAARCNSVPPYLPADVQDLAGQTKVVEYGQQITVGPVTVTLANAGHILGSATVTVEAQGKRILFTGDLGRVPTSIVPDRDVPPGPIDYLVTESVYGNRTHEDGSASEQALLDAVRHTHQRRGTLLIPSFSLERTQIILALLDRFVSEQKIPQIPVFLDSPLAAKVTEVYEHFPQYLREDIRARLQSGDDPFSFPALLVTHSVEDSKAIDAMGGAKVILAGAGMSHGGRIRDHEKRFLPDPKTMLLLVGYQVPGSLGRRLKDGARKVNIDGTWISVRAKILSTGGFSAHADRDDLLKFAEAVKPKQAFVVLGEMSAATFLAQRISGFLGIKTVIPQEGERYVL